MFFFDETKFFLNLMSYFNNRYKKITRLGEGAYGRVFLVVDEKEKSSPIEKKAQNNTENLLKEEENKNNNSENSQQKFYALKKMKMNVY